MAHEDIKQYLIPGYPIDTGSDTQNGFEYQYIGPDDKIRNFVPKVNQDWFHTGATGTYYVTSRTFTPLVENSKYSKLEVTTVCVQAAGGTRVGINVDAKKEGESRYQIRWTPKTLPLNQHPYFRALTGTAKTTFLRDMQGWENELSETNRTNYQYYKRDSDGNATGSLVTIPSETAAYRYVTLRLLGHENYILFEPSLQKVSQYRGTQPPPSDTIGKKIDTAGGPPDVEDKLFKKPTWFTKWGWVKTDDTAVTVGNTSLWERTETWTGGLHVDYDVDQIFIGGDPTTPPTTPIP